MNWLYSMPASCGRFHCHIRKPAKITPVLTQLCCHEVTAKLVRKVPPAGFAIEIADRKAN